MWAELVFSGYPNECDMIRANQQLPAYLLRQAASMKPGPDPTRSRCRLDTARPSNNGLHLLETYG